MKEKASRVKQVYDPEILPDLLPLYYKRLFPHLPFYRWLSYGNGKYIQYQQYLCEWSLTYFVMFSWFVCFHASRVLVYSVGRYLSKISVVRKPNRIWGRIMFEESYKIWHRPRDERSVRTQYKLYPTTDIYNFDDSLKFQSPRPQICLNHDTDPTWVSFWYWHDWLWWGANVLFRC